MTSRANCKLALTEQKSQKSAQSTMTIKKGGQALPVTNEMIGNVLQRLMAA